MATYDELIAALRNAHAAGDTAGARELARRAEVARISMQAPPAAVVPQDAPSPGQPMAETMVPALDQIAATMVPKPPVLPGMEASPVPPANPRITAPAPVQVVSQAAPVAAPASPGPSFEAVGRSNPGSLMDMATIAAAMTGQTAPAPVAPRAPLTRVGPLPGQPVKGAAGGPAEQPKAAIDPATQGPAGGPIPPGPFDNETLGALFKRRGQEVVGGAADVLASNWEGLGAMQGRSMRTPESAAAAGTMAAERDRTIAEIQARIAAGGLSAAEVSILEQRLADLYQGRDRLNVIASGAGMPPEMMREFEGKAAEIRAAAEAVTGRAPQDASFWSKLAQGTGSMLGFMGATVSGAALAGPMGGLGLTASLGSLSNAGQVYQEAKKSGAAEDDALSAAGWAFIVGSSEALPLGRAFHLLPSKLRDKAGELLSRRLGGMIVNSGEEAAQEWIQQVSNNLIAAGYYDPQRGWLDGATENAIIGAILGAGTGFIGASSAPDKRNAPADPSAALATPATPAPIDQIASAMTAPPAAPAQPAADAAPVAPAPAKPVNVSIESQAPFRAEVVADDYRGVTIREADGTESVISRQDIADGAVRIVPADNSVPDEVASAADLQSAPPETPAPAAVPEPSAPQPAQQPAPAPANQPSNFEFLNAQDVQGIGTEPGVMQYKAGGDAEGVTDRLKGVTEWRPERAGVSVVYEYADGRRVIADGHQRLGLAKRLAAQGKPIQMPVMVLRQADGVTPEDARVTAALKNIAEGSGTALDAAKVLRGSRQTVQDMALPPGSAIVRDAMGMRDLSDAAFGMVVNGVASERDGGIVGRVVTDQAAQANILGLLARMQKDRPITAFQAEQVARQAAADTVTETQDSLFGPESDTKNLYLERAKIIESATRMKREELRAFKNVVENADRLEAAGNQLDTDANQSAVDSAARLRDYLSREANTKGPISDALTEAARALNGGASVADATRQFLAAAERVAAGGLDQGQPAQGGGARSGGDQGIGTPDQQRDPEPRPREPVDQGADLFAPPQTGKSPDQVRAEAEATVRAQQSMIRKPGGNSGDAGPLFDTQGDLLAQGQTKPDPRSDLIAAGKKALEPFGGWQDLGGDATTRHVESSDPKAHAELVGKLAAANTLADRAKIADAWVQKHGTTIEHAVVLDADGTPLSVTSGHKHGVNVPVALLRYAQNGGAIGHVTHSHPSGSALSAADILLTNALGQARAASAVEAAVLHTARPGPAMPDFDIFDSKAWDRLFPALKDVDGLCATLGQANFNKHQDTSRALRVQRAAFNLMLARLEVIRYNGPAAQVLESEGVDFDAHFDANHARARTWLRRAGFAVAEVGDQGGNRPSGGAAAGDGRGPDGGSVTPQLPAQAAGGGDRGGRVQDKLEEDPTEDGLAFAASILDQLAQVDELFQNKASAATTLKGVFADIDPTVTYEGDVAAGEGSTFKERADKAGAERLHLLRTAKGADFFVFEGDGNVWMDVSNLEEGTAGSAIYQAVADYAYNTRQVFIGDPDGLSAKALRRRTENMLASALKHGTTRHLEPHSYQLSGDESLGVPPMSWQTGDDAGNVRSMIAASLGNLLSKVPELARARYDFQSGTFRSSQGEPLSDGMLEGWASAHPRVRAASAGRDTLKRGILLNTLAQTERGKRPGLLEQALRIPSKLVARGLGRTFYDRPALSADKAAVILKQAWAKRDALKADLQKRWEQIAPPGVSLRVVDRLLGLDPDGRRVPINGQYITGLAKVALDSTSGTFNTLHHEAIHMLKDPFLWGQPTGLFRPQEWFALEEMATRGRTAKIEGKTVVYPSWIEKHRIAEIYPDLTPEQQVEEAIAAEFAEHAEKGTSPTGTFVVRAFNRAARFLKALGRALIGSGIKTPEAVADLATRTFDAVLVGDVARRAREVQRKAGSVSAQSRRDTTFTTEARDRIAAANAAYGAPVAVQAPLPGVFPVPPRRMALGGSFRGVTFPELIQSKFSYFTAINEAIENATGQPIPDTQNFRLRQMLYPGRSAAKVEKVLETEVRPIVATMRAEGLTVDDVGIYLMAKHAKERNAIMAQRDPERFANGNGSGLYDEAADDLLADFASKGMTAKLERVAVMVRAMLAKDLAERRNAGLISNEQHDAYKAMYRHYVPLRGHAEREDGEQIGTLGRGFDIRGKEVKAALGRMSIAENPLIQAIAMRQEGVTRSEKNRAGQALLKQVQAYPQPELWEIIGKLPTRKVLDPDTGQVRGIVDFGAMREDEVIGVKVAGQTQYIRLRNLILAEAVKNIGVERMGYAEFLMHILSRATRAFARMTTGANIGFVFPNAQADFLTALWTAWDADVPGMTAGFAKYYPIALAVSAQGAMREGLVGRGIARLPGGFLRRVLGHEPTPEELLEIEKKREQWIAAGGKITYQGWRDMDELTRQIDEEIGKAGARGWAGRLLQVPERLLRSVELINQPFEDAARFAMFMAATNTGMSEEKAARLALDASGNFFERGFATPYFAAAFAFFNPAIQGTEKFIRMAKKPRNWRVMGATMAAGYALALINMWLYGDDDDPEGYPLYLDINEFERNRSLIIGTGKTEDTPYQTVDDNGRSVTKARQRLDTLMFRIPHELRPLWALGQEVAALVYSGQTGKTVQTPAGALDSVSRALLMNVNPFGSENFWNMIAPTALDPFVDTAFNRTFTGAPIHPQEQTWNEGVARSHQYFDSRTPDYAVAMSRWLNTVSGGNNIEPGLLDVYPGDLAHIAGYWASGAGRFGLRAYEAMANMYQGIPSDPNDVPLLSSLKGRTNDSAASARFYEMREDMNGQKNRIRAAFSDLREDPTNETAKAIWEDAVRNHGVVAGTKKDGIPTGKISWGDSDFKLIEDADDAVRDIREQIRLVQNDEMLSPKDRALKERELRAQMEAEMDRGRRAVLDFRARVSAATGTQQQAP